MNSSSGVPTICSILVNWSIWSDPGNNTWPVNSSAIIHPTDHMSTRERDRDRKRDREREREIERERETDVFTNTNKHNYTM